MKTATILVSIALAVVGQAERGRNQPLDPSRPVIPHCLVTLIDEAQVPAPEAGVLKTVEVREGSSVTKGYVLAQIDDTQQQILKNAALAEKAGAEAQAKDDIGVRFAKAAADVAKANWDMGNDANARVPNSVAVADINQRKLDYTKSLLQIEKSALEQKVAGFTVQAKDAEVAKADNDIVRRKIVAPVDGEVVAVLRHVGEWVQPGDALLRLVRLDRLRVEGFINAKDFNPQDINGRPVSVVVELAKGQKATFEGKIVFVSPLVEAGGDYSVWAEVANKPDNGQWILRPGTNADMTIMVK